MIIQHHPYLEIWIFLALVDFIASIQNGNQGRQKVGRRWLQARIQTCNRYRRTIVSVYGLPAITGLSSHIPTISTPKWILLITVLHFSDNLQESPLFCCKIKQLNLLESCSLSITSPTLGFLMGLFQSDSRVKKLRFTRAIK